MAKKVFSQREQAGQQKPNTYADFKYFFEYLQNLNKNIHENTNNDIDDCFPYIAQVLNPMEELVVELIDRYEELPPRFLSPLPTLLNLEQHEYYKMNV